MPLIEERYSVLKGPENTGLGGSSLGGLITLYTQLAAPGVFGRLLIESPSSVRGEAKNSGREPSIFGLAGAHVPRGGDAGNGAMRRKTKFVADVRELEAILREAGVRRNAAEGSVSKKALRTANRPGQRAFRGAGISLLDPQCQAPPVVNLVGGTEILASCAREAT
jgi:pimeloyl-ACP methyl ester carboxylesterase